MSAAAETADRPQIADVIKQAANGLDGDDRYAATRFAELYYKRVSPEDVEAYGSEALVGAVRSAWAFLEEREPGRAKLRAYNPDGDADGWQSSRTVIEIATDDMPFLVDSVMADLHDQDLRVHTLIHPTFSIRRDMSGHRLGLGDPEEEDSIAESLIHLEIDSQADSIARERILARIEIVLQQVRLAVEDWPQMMTRLDNTIEELTACGPKVGAAEHEEALEFLRWLRDENFTFLGFREYAFDNEPGGGDFKEVEGSGLGILRDPEVHILRRGIQLVSMTPEIRDSLLQPQPLIITKANVRSAVHRRVHMDYLGVKRFDERGQVIGECRFVGLFTATAYTRSAESIPLLRHRVRTVLGRAGYGADSHSGRALINVLESYPRDELLQCTEDELLENALGIMRVMERPHPKAFVRHDRFDRFVSVIVCVPRDRYDTELRVQIGEILTRAYNGRPSAFYPRFGDGPLALVHFIIGRNEGDRPRPDLAEINREIARATRTWTDDLNDALVARWGPGKANRLIASYDDAFEAGYRETYSAETAIEDIERFDLLQSPEDLAVDFCRPEGTPVHAVRLKVYRINDPIPLSDRVPMLENMGFRVVNERSFSISPKNRPRTRMSDEPVETSEVIWIHEMSMKTRSGEPLDLHMLKDKLEATFQRVWTGLAEDDGFNSLVLLANLAWRDIAILRAYCKYLRQAGIAFSQEYIRETITQNPKLATSLVELFYALFDPAQGTPADERRGIHKLIRGRILEGLQEVDSLDQDRILRRYVNLVEATLRTNFFQVGPDGHPKPYISFKLESHKIQELPKPHPHAEIYVYSPRFEGVHLRGGSIARGGLRWSDRREDFRTEVLGLVKAQNVKNAVIVPVGAKGGFVPKYLPVGGSREEIQAEGVACYKTFIRGLLDVTDNLDGDRLVPPDGVVRFDGDDPYLVVAADKGTATFSDIANEISTGRDFWLGDAFASGGSAGYDHKKMGITARGGWEAVKRHFRELDRDIQSDPFTAIGCGDMSGDVFGNGMLLSEQTRLIAAFDHRDIFIDPDPHPTGSHAERKRMFELPRSSWQDYDEGLISEGGGVFSRSLKAIPLSDQIRELTGLEGETATPNELIRALLKVEADLLWFGGIGTYVKASDETNLAVGDRANDDLRINANELRVKVVGEGANLGITQNARIEFALNGGRINTDAIDNSAGVNSSDLEVNIKIAFGAPLAAGEITIDQRNTLLERMTDEVAGLVLRNNYLQTLALTLAAARGVGDLWFQVRLMRELENDGRLDRQLEDLPDDQEIGERAASGKGLTRPELSVLLAYAKIKLFDVIIESDVPDDPYLSQDLQRYFPKALQEQFGEAIEGHRLRREIIATMLSNSMVNRGGTTFASRINDETGADVAQIARAYAVARGSFDVFTMFDDINALDNKIPTAVQTEMHLEVQNLLRQQTLWFVRQLDRGADIVAAIGRFGAGVRTLEASLDELVGEEAAAQINADTEALTSFWVPEKLARRIASLGRLGSAGCITLTSEECSVTVEQAARVYFDIGRHLRIDWLRQKAGDIKPAEHYERLALNRTLESLQGTQRLLAVDALNAEGADASADGWAAAHAAKLQLAMRRLDELESGGPLTLPKLAVAAGTLADLVGA